MEARAINNEEVVYQISTNAARYAPGDTVFFNIKFPAIVTSRKMSVIYFHLADTVGQQNIYAAESDAYSWSWMPPKADYQGYMAEVTIFESGSVAGKTAIAVDVSSDWAHFPRYGFVSKFPEMTLPAQQSVIQNLNRFHINGLQFYDWHYKHNMPIKMNGDSPALYWNDIANRVNYFSTIKNYIDEAHKCHMKTMAYNLLYGAFSNSYQDGVKDEWGLYTDALHNKRYMYELPSSWSANLYFMDPSNIDWENYIFTQEATVFKYLPFDGWHVDQVGNPGTVYNYNGKAVAVNNTFYGFLSAAKKRLGVPLVMNAVGQYGQEGIAVSPVDCLYSEVWAPNDTYASLVSIINNNSLFSQNKKNTILAAYMDYKLSSNAGVFNTPGVLLTDAFIFAAGGAHLELGEHMLCHEYFPNNNLTMTSSLKERLVRYYDFLTAYENILRDSLTCQNAHVSSSGKKLLSAAVKTGTIWQSSKTKDERQIIHLINLTNASSANWRDDLGTQTEPDSIQNIPLTVSTTREIKRIWMASPDYNNGLPESIEFKQSASDVNFNIPFLKYWTVVVFEYKEKSVGVKSDRTNSPDSKELGLKCYPNPFNSSIMINFNLKKQSKVKIEIFDALGRKINDLPGGGADAGHHSLAWAASAMPSGLYFCRVSTIYETQVIKILLVK
jgi:dextranase